jgi:hypothetical protein
MGYSGEGCKETATLRQSFLRLTPEHILIAAILTVLWTASGLAQEPDLINADRPGIADGSTVVGPGTFQIESGVQAEFRRHDDSREHTLFIPTLLRFGIDSHWEVRIEGNTCSMAGGKEWSDECHSRWWPGLYHPIPSFTS